MRVASRSRYALGVLQMSEHSEQAKVHVRRLLASAMMEISLEDQIEAARTLQGLADKAREAGLDKLAEMIGGVAPVALPAPDGPKRRGRPPGSKNRVNSANHFEGDRFYDAQVEAAD